MSRFARVVKKHGGRRAVADRLQCSVEFVRLLSIGEKTPGLALALRIQEELKIPVSYWKQGTALNSET